MKNLNFHGNVERLFAEVRSVLGQVSPADVAAVIEQLLKAKRIYVAGGGRSGLMARTFAQRLMQLGLVTYVVGETTTPGIQKDDVLLVCSGSGETQVTVLMSRVAKEIGARVIAVTANAESQIAHLADTVLLLRAPYKSAPQKGVPSIQYAGSLFEQSLLILFDAISLEVGRILGLSEQELRQRHANLE